MQAQTCSIEIVVRILGDFRRNTPSSPILVPHASCPRDSAAAVGAAKVLPGPWAVFARPCAPQPADSTKPTTGLHGALQRRHHLAFRGNSTKAVRSKCPRAPDSGLQAAAADLGKRKPDEGKDQNSEAHCKRASHNITPYMQTSPIDA